MKSLMFFFSASAFLAIGCVGPVTKTIVTKPLHEVSYGHDIVRTSASESAYATHGLCGGLPRVTSVKTAPGFCLGIVDSGAGLVKPRYALQIDADHILVTDMGGWTEYHGQVYLLTQTHGQWQRSSLLNAKNMGTEKKCILNRTHQLVKGTDGLIYITSAECVATLDPNQKDMAATLQIKIKDLPTDGLHASKVIVFDGADNIYMNIGSRTDNCENEASDVCQETEGLNGRALIRKYRKIDGGYDENYSIFARGQRNSLALYWSNENNELWTGENARDYINRVDTRLNGLEHPGDEFNVIREGAQLDWPYCYDNGLMSPEFPRADCSRYQHPYLIFPAHSAPLSFLMYNGSQFPKWYQNRLLISFHGSEAYGHRIVAYKRNEKLQPVGDPLSIVYGWAAHGSQSVGSPVGLTQTPDGGILIVEDNSQKVLKLFYNATEGDGQPVAELKIGTDKMDDSEVMKAFLRTQNKRKAIFEKKLQGPNVPLFSQIQSQLIDQNCVACHGGLNYRGVQLLMYDDVGNYKKIKDQILKRVTGNGVPQMPPYGLPENVKSSLVELLNKWTAAGSPPP